jgi:hypothetical protein
MAIKFHPNIAKLLLGKGILSGLTTTVAVTLFKGSQPTAADVTANWTTHSPNVLVHWTGVGFTQPFNDLTLGVNVFPTPTVATGTGTATWAIIWATNVATLGGTLPNTSFLVVPASNTSNLGVIRVLNENITSGQSIGLAEGTIKAASV